MQDDCRHCCDEKTTVHHERHAKKSSVLAAQLRRKCLTFKTVATRLCFASFEADFQSIFFHLQQRFGIAASIINGIVRVFCFAQVFEVGEGVLYEAFVERSEIR